MFSEILHFEGIRETDAQVLWRFIELLERVFISAESFKCLRRMNGIPFCREFLMFFYFGWWNRMLNDSAISGNDWELWIDLVKYCIKKSGTWKQRFGSYIQRRYFLFDASHEKYPFKVICLLGMNNDAIPENQVHTAFILSQMIRGRATGRREMTISISFFRSLYLL